MGESWVAVALVGVLILVAWWRARPNDDIWRDL
jgi:hypothetical protein